MTTQLAPNSMSLPPPSSFELDLLDGDRAVGWISGSAVGFRGFANETEAAHAAWVAHRTLARRLARRHGGRPAPIDVEPLAIARDADRETILASGRPVATLVRPSANSRSGPETFGFEIQVPVAADELAMRSKGYLMYRTLRKSGLRWAMWDKRRAVTPRPAVARRQPVAVPAPRPGQPLPSAIAFVSKLVLAAIATVMGAALVVAAPRTVTVPIGMVLVAGLVASGLVALVGRWRAARSSRPAAPRRSSSPHTTDLRDAAGLRDRSDESMRELGWLALGIVSITVLVLALVVPEEIAVAFAAIGFGGLVAFRVTAAWGGWVPHRNARGESRAQSDQVALQREVVPNVAPSRSNGARGGPSQRMAAESRNGTSPRLTTSSRTRISTFR
jgi:hypothetical protein